MLGRCLPRQEIISTILQRIRVFPCYISMQGTSGMRLGLPPG
jgi:hypothetical protein